MRHALSDAEWRLIDLDTANREELAAILESINDAVEENYTEDRFQYFQNCFLNTVSGSGTDDYQKARRFVSILSNLRDIDVQVLEQDEVRFDHLMAENRSTRLGASRSAMQSIGQAMQRRPMGRFSPPSKRRSC